MSHLGGRIAVALCVLSLSACEDPELVTPVPVPLSAEIQRYVTGEAAQGLNAQGQFDLTVAEAGSSTSSRSISPSRARDLALAFVRTWGSVYQPLWEKERGGAVDAGSLEPHPRVYRAETPYGSFPTGFHPAFARAFGPWYLVSMVSGEEPVLLVAVSAYATDLKIDGHGYLVEPLLSGNDLVTWTISASPKGYRPATPEQAVALVGRATGARTERVPELWLLDSSHHPGSAVWRTALDRTVQVRPRSGEPPRQVRELFVGPGGRLFTPSASQPESHRTTAIRVDAEGNRIGAATVDVPIQGGRPVNFTEVMVDGGGAQ